MIRLPKTRLLHFVDEVDRLDAELLCLAELLKGFQEPLDAGICEEVGRIIESVVDRRTVLEAFFLNRDMTGVAIDEALIEGEMTKLTRRYGPSNRGDDDE